jgi:transposase-like protein
MRAIMQGLTDAEFERLYGTEEQCLAAWVKVRQDAGMTCPRCGNAKTYVYGERVGCTRCDTRWSITSGTVMADTKLPLTTWFRGMHLMTSTKQGLSAVELGRRLGVSYPTAWYLHKRLRHAMTQESERCQLGAPLEDGGPPIVEADDGYLGGECNEGSGTAGKTRVIAACERHPSGRMGTVAMRVVESFSNPEAAAFRDAHLAPGARVYPDGTPAFAVFGEGGRSHVATITGSKRPERDRDSLFFNVNTVISNLSTAIKATFKRFSPKHLPDYLGAFCWTTNHRRRMRDMIGALCRAAATSSRLTRRSVYAQQALSCLYEMVQAAAPG